MSVEKQREMERLWQAKEPNQSERTYTENPTKCFKELTSQFSDKCKLKQWKVIFALSVSRDGRKRKILLAVVQ